MNPTFPSEAPRLSFAVAEPPGLTLAGEAQEIVQVARSGLRRLRGRPADGEPALSKPNLLQRIRARLAGTSDAADDATRAILGDILVELDGRIDSFVTAASLFGSPPEYQQELRSSRLALLALLDEGVDAENVSIRSYKTLTHVVDLVDLTRRDVERRILDQPMWAARLILGELPTDQPARVEALVGVACADLPQYASGNLTLDATTARRLRVVAQVIYDLRYSHKPFGLLAWFEQRFDHLDGRSPLELLDELSPENETALREYARSLRAQTAT